jgi:tetratricopeptide (TPR) repeat protein
MVYGCSMTPVLAVLLLSAATSTGAATPGTTAPPEAPATTSEPTAEPATTIEPAAPSPDPRMEAYEQFRGLYQTARYAEALPFAQRVVELSEADPDREHELPTAYNNLAAVQFQVGDYMAARNSYEKSLELIEVSHGISSRRLVVPLAGLGAVHAALDQHEIATAMLARALAVNRRSEGLFNLAQLPLIEQAAASHFAIGDFHGVERERLYALKIAEQHYGYQDERTLPPILKLATFYELLGDYVSARLMYMRARDASMQESGGFNPQAIRSLLGIARSLRLQFTLDPDQLNAPVPTRDDITGELATKAFRRETLVLTPNANRDGLKAALQALELLRAASDPPRDLLAETLIELADWYQATSRPALAMPHYTEAALLLAADPESAADNPLRAPRVVFYRPPSAASRGPNATADGYMVRKTVFRLGVSETGETRDIEVVSSDMSEQQISQSRRAVARAIYSPRFEDGRPVSTEGVTLTADWYELPRPGAEPADESASGG